MQLQAHFDHIQQVITQHLRSAQSEILVAVAWFTDRKIFDVLCKQAQTGVQVSVAVLGDTINQAPGALHFQRLRDLGGKVIFLPPGSAGDPMMHHKFCVLDGVTVITGSYNWSNKAQRNDENITVATDAAEFAAKYRQAFHDLLARAGQTGAAAQLQVDTQAVRRRLETVRNLILLGEQDSLPAHLSKLRPVTQAPRLQPILQALEKGAYKDVLEFIEDYLRSSSAVVLHGDADIPLLQLQLQSLELRLESLSAEKTDLDRRLVIFNRRYRDALGALLLKVLVARAALARRKTAQEAEQAQQDWQDYRRYYTEQQAQTAPHTLNAQEEAELKTLYRKASSLCHPDKFAEAQKDAANQAFVKLREVYTANDLPALRELYAALKAGGLPNAPRSSTLSRADALRATIAELQRRITQALHQLQALHNSEGAALLRSAGETDADWPAFFTRQEQLLQAELAQLQQAIAAYGAADTK